MDFSIDDECSDIIVCNTETVEQVKQLAKLMTIFLKINSKLTDSYILDYFVEKLWTKLPNSWINTVMEFESEDLANFLDPEKQIRYKNPWPLSLLSFRACAFSLSLPRKPVTSLDKVKSFIRESYKNNHLEILNWDIMDSGFEVKSGQHKNMPEYCRRHVKPKKQHEIFCMGQLAAFILRTFGVKQAIDIGSGQGHLSRFLSFCFNVKVATIEAEGSRISSATNYDKQALITMKNPRELLKVVPPYHAIGLMAAEIANGFSLDDNESNTHAVEHVLPYHLKGLLTSETAEEFLNKIFKRPEGNADSKEPYALLGLHTCGDLAETILRLFTDCKDSKVVLSVGCCYMKSSSDMNNSGYPLSLFVKSLPSHHLTYEAMEMACHALEMYREKLKENASSLKIHCYRATLEKCIVHHYPDKKHMGLRGVKNAENLPFPVYAREALRKVNCLIPEEFYSSPEIQACLDKWKEVLVFYSLRLLIAPVVESLILLDRMLFLYEHGYPSCLVPLFDPEISPRNYVIVSAKNMCNKSCP